MTTATTHPRALPLLGLPRAEMIEMLGPLPRCASDDHWRAYCKMGGELAVALGNEPERVIDYLRGKIEAAKSLGGRVCVLGADMGHADRDRLFEGRLVDFGPVWAQVEFDAIGSRSVLLGVVRPCEVQL